MKRSFTVVSAWAAIVICLLNNVAIPQQTQAGSVAIPSVVAAVDGATSESRSQAMIEAARVREATERAIRERLETLFPKGDRDAAGSLKAAILMAGTYRFDACIPILVEHLTFTLDPSTFPVGARISTTAYYPCATALRQIGNKQVVAAVLDGLKKTNAPDDVKVSSWVLEEVLGNALAERLLSDEVERLAPAQAVAKENLKQALESLRSENALPPVK
jgi:hypothetical protein